MVPSPISGRVRACPERSRRGGVNKHKISNKPYLITDNYHPPPSLSSPSKGGQAREGGKPVSPNNEKAMKQDINLLIEAVLKKPNALGKIYKQYGQLSLFNYVNSWPVNNNVLDSGFIQLLEEVFKEYCPTESHQVIQQIINLPLVSTIDHYGILNHPFFINSNLVFSLKANIKYLICLPTAGVSLNNSSWPGSLMRFSPKNKTRWSFFADKDKHLPVLSAPAIKAENKLIARLPKDISDIWKETKAFEEKTYLKQASLLSSNLWHSIFPDAPKVIYVPLETLINRMLTDLIIPNPAHPLHTLFFSLEGWQWLEQYFLEAKGFCGKNFGSFIFWAINTAGKRERLEKYQDALIGSQLKYELDLAQITHSLKSGTLYPTSLVCFMVLMYYGLTMIGGFNQVNWLTEIKERLMKLWTEVGEINLVKQLVNLPTENFAEGNLSFLFSHQAIYKPSAIDIVFYKDKALYKKYVALSKQLTVAESLQTLLPEIYKISVPKVQRSLRLEKITEDEIINEIGLTQKVRAGLDFLG